MHIKSAARISVANFEALGLQGEVLGNNSSLGFL